MSEDEKRLAERLEAYSAGALGIDCHDLDKAARLLRLLSELDSESMANACGCRDFGPDAYAPPNTECAYHANLRARAEQAESSLAAANKRVSELEKLLKRWAALWTAGNVDFDSVACAVANDTAAALTAKEGANG